jgi:hypothetical protein
VSEDPNTEELRRAQVDRERAERESAAGAPSEPETEQHDRRADKAAYLKDKLDERAASERKAAAEDSDSEGERESS